MTNPRLALLLALVPACRARPLAAPTRAATSAGASGATPAPRASEPATTAVAATGAPTSGSSEPVAEGAEPTADALLAGMERADERNNAACEASCQSRDQRCVAACGTPPSENCQLMCQIEKLSCQRECVGRLLRSDPPEPLSPP